MDDKKIMYYALEAILSRYFLEQKRAESGSKIAKNLVDKYKAEIDFLHDKIVAFETE
jgi:hypothetical protein